MQDPSDARFESLKAANNARVASVTVAFNPSPERFASQLRALFGQVAQIIIVDNGSTEPASQCVDAELRGRILWHRAASNLGIAAALNLGITLAQEADCDSVLLMDHDSVPEEDMVARLGQALDRLEDEPGGKVVAVGPRIIDPRNRFDFPFVRLGWFNNHKISCSDPSATIDSDFLITSGTLARRATFEAAALGPFDESLFIDSVDMEWCYRARARGMRLVGVCAARLDHRLGDRRDQIGFGVTLIVHSPLRLYYMTRNRVALYRRGYIPLKWKIKDAVRMVLKLVISTLFLAPRLTYLQMGLRGLLDALCGRSGPYRPRP